MTITLKTPIQFGSETIRELKFRDPKAKDIRSRADNLNTDELLNLAQDLSAQPQYVMDELSIPDMYAVLDAMGKFLKAGLPTGERPSQP